MTNERINERIALLCGWERDSQNGFQPTWKNTDGTRYAESLLPNYAADLNDCHKFEKTLNRQQWFQYNCYLFRQVVPFNEGDCWDADNSRHCIHATARQRCEAFLRVHGQWEEEV